MIKSGEISRRDVLKSGVNLGAVAFTASTLPWVAMAQDEELIPFSDIPDSWAPGSRRPGSGHIIDTRNITSFYSDDFYVVQHYGESELDVDAYRLRISGLVEQPREYTLQELMSFPAIERDIAFECGGNRDQIFNGLVGNARWRGISLSSLLRESGVNDDGAEVVFFGADIGTEEIRGRSVDQAFARSLPVSEALNEHNMLAFEMNGSPLPAHHGKPLRLIVPGYYGVANVKWLTHIHVQNTRYMGRFMGRDYVTLKHENIGGVDRWMENSVARMNLKSVIVRVTRRSSSHRITGFVLNDGTALQSVEVRIDNGPWQQAQIDSQSSTFSWKYFYFDWQGASVGEHTIVSRATDINGHVQPTTEEMPEKVSRWEEFAQFPRKLTIS
jgi:DMSO/TMAO reductase YedYZ molybdopterin-dependent catalytic subunit